MPEDFKIPGFPRGWPRGASKTHIEQLKAAGALDGMPDTSQITLF